MDVAVVFVARPRAVRSDFKEIVGDMEVALGAVARASAVGRPIGGSGVSVTRMARAADVMIRGYQLLVRPLFPAACRFVPSCSEYGRLAVQSCGAARGLWLTAPENLPLPSVSPGRLRPPACRERLTASHRRNRS